ncbi:MAG: DUF4333 domain-containing protein [Solirubrobacteraceae bacterium]|nr:DUF4333 domain-containing protein [Solirubrobacteraceae bacterium]
MSLFSHRSLTLTAAALIGAATFAGCGDDEDTPGATTGGSTPTTQLDTTKVERAIKDSIKEQRDIRARVTCPESVLQAKGRDFVCVAKTKDGETNFAVQQTDDNGNVTYAAAQ